MTTPATATRQPRVAIIGAGPGGICLAIRLREAGFDKVTLYEKSEGVGGTWNHNRYPGAACDVQSHLYSFSFEIKTDWTRPYATQPEILDYMEQVVDKYDLLPLIRFSTPVVAAHWDDECTLWRIVIESPISGAREAVEADILVSAIGMFNDLVMPDIAGLDEFTGTMFHSARWDHTHDLTGDRIAVIGSAASAVQFVPEVAKAAGRLHLFQRTPNWVLPKDDTPFTLEQLEQFAIDPVAARQARWEIFRRVEGAITYSNPVSLKASEEAGRRNIAAVDDLDLRAKLTPTEPYGCRRPLSSNVYYPTFNRPHVELVTEHITRVTPTGVVTDDGVEREVDTIIFGTGFATTKYASAIDIRGRGGARIDDAWSDGAQAYLGITTTGFPNLFMLYGPNTNNGSIIFMLEYQVAYIVRHLDRMRSGQIAWIDVRRDVMDAYNNELQHDLEQVEVWNENCNTGYYRGGAKQRIVTQWPHTMAAYRDRTQTPDDEHYEAHPGRPLAATRP